jgi:hypothetical protein
MAFTQQDSKAKTTRVSIEFPTLPGPPEMTIAKDQEKMKGYAIAMEAWYNALRSSLLDKLNSLQSQIDTLKSQ